MDLYSALSLSSLVFSKALRYDPTEAGTQLPTPEGWKADWLSWPWVAGWLHGWLVTYRNKCPAPGIKHGHGRPSQY